MSDRQRDEQLLIDFELGRCDQAAGEEVRRRLREDAGFAALHESIVATFQALGRHDEPAAPGNLVERTMARVQAMRRTESLLEAQPARRRVFLPTFSMRELAALAAAAVLVVGIVIPAMRHARRRADSSLCKGNLGQIGWALNHYAGENAEAFPVSPAQAGSWLPSPGRPGASNSAALFLLVRHGFAKPGIFLCPAAGGQSFADADIAAMMDFPSPRSIGYSYQHSLAGPIRRSDPELAEVADQMAVMVDATPVFPDGTFHPDRVHRKVSENHPEGGQNVLYVDGHVTWVRDCLVGVNGNNIFLAEGIYSYTGDEQPVSPIDTFVLPNVRE